MKKLLFEGDLQQVFAMFHANLAQTSGNLNGVSYDVHGICTECAWNVHEMCTKCARKVRGIFMRCASWTVHEMCTNAWTRTERAWDVCELCMRCTGLEWNVYGAWDLHELCETSTTSSLITDLPVRSKRERIARCLHEFIHVNTQSQTKHLLPSSKLHFSDTRVGFLLRKPCLHWNSVQISCKTHGDRVGTNVNVSDSGHGQNRWIWFHTLKFFRSTQFRGLS